MNTALTLRDYLNLKPYGRAWTMVVLRRVARACEMRHAHDVTHGYLQTRDVNLDTNER